MEELVAKLALLLRLMESLHSGLHAALAAVPEDKHQGRMSGQQRSCRADRMRHSCSHLLLAFRMQCVSQGSVRS